VLRNLVDDLKDIEQTGLKCGDTYLKGSVICISGDNLGSHYIGGFVENFSSTSHFCRYCLITRSEFAGNPTVNFTQERTSESYNAAVQHMQVNPDIRIYQGIKWNSIFNELQHFNVCQPGLPPCLGHDLFEGVIAYDLPLYIKYFVKTKKWFSYDILNQRIASFTYMSTDALDKPNPVSHDGNRLGGNAVQNWCLLRLLPLIIGDKICEVSDEVWQLLLLLVRITAMICAPKVSVGQIACMQLLIEEYLEARYNMFPEVKMRPKHHYLSHYPALTLKFGPLIRVWTMRFEAKHAYFKRCMRFCQNFSNITSLLAERHQMLQAYLATGTMFAVQTFQVSSASPFYVELHCQQIQDAVMPYHMTSTNTVVSDRCHFKGTEFHKGHYVIISPEADEIFTVAEFLLVLVQNGSLVFFVVRTCSSVRDTELAAVRVSDVPGMIICKEPHELLIHEHPLPAYDVRNQRLIALKYATFDRI
jgi:hypothetical protein